MQCLETKYLIPYILMSDLLQFKLNWMTFLDTNKLITYLLISDLCVNSIDLYFWYLSSKNYQKNMLIFFTIFLFISKWNKWYLFYVSGWYSTMNTTIFSFFPIIIISVKKLVLLLYHDDTVDVGYNQQVGNTVNLVVHDNIGLTLTLHDNANYIMFY